MAKFKVFYNIPTFYSIDIEAESEDAAIEIFTDELWDWDMERSPKYLDSGDPELDCVEECPNG